MSDDWQAVRIDVDPDGSRPSGVVLTVRGEMRDFLMVETAPGRWTIYGPPNPRFREGDAGWFVAYIPDGHQVALPVVDAPDTGPGWLRFAQPGEQVPA